MSRLLVILCLCIFSAAPLSAQNRAKVENSFQSWLNTTAWPLARQKGVSRKTFGDALGNIKLNWKLPDLVPPGQPKTVPKIQRQSEFGSPSKYFRAGIVESSAQTGRQMAKRYASTLARLEQSTGIPRQIILAIWGRESAYGHAKIPHSAFRVLATKAFMSTRSEYFTEELVAALQIAEQGHVSAASMKSSWAGALGQPQFMPTSFLKFAADGDGDGRADIWSSERDTIASIANFLARHGWDKNRDWGFEVKVPRSVSCSLEGPDQGRPISDWKAMGIERSSGRPFPAHETQGEGYLMMPAGRMGPAFIVTPNFYVIKEYNKSDLYALFVGHVGDKIQFNVGNFKGQWAAQAKLRRGEVADMQNALERAGYDVGGVDGLVGYKTRRSIGRWQEKKGLVSTCFPDRKILARILQ